jgi:thiamine-monophosphate kinase
MGGPTELELVEALRAMFAREDARVTLGIGDDAAVLEVAASSLVWTIDDAVEGTHFRRDLASLEDVGYRCTMAAASDLAAMGARPLAMLASVVLPTERSGEVLEIARGQRAAADELSASVIGGNLARGPHLGVTTTWLGTAEAPVRRGGAGAGDEVWLAGPVGLAAAGLAALEQSLATPVELAVAAWRRPIARVAEGRSAARLATAMIDVSDGLARDAGHLAHASDVSIVLDAERIVTEALVDAARALSRDPLELALHGGEDYALLATAPLGVTLAEFTRVGRCIPAQGEPSVWLERGAEPPARVVDLGFDHFARR